MVSAESMDSGNADKTFKLRAIHRVVRAMNDGACPKCGVIADRDVMVRADFPGLRCPACDFAISYKDAATAMQQFSPVMAESVAIFEEWRDRERRLETIRSSIEVEAMFGYGPNT